MNIWLVNPFDGLPSESFRPGRYAFLSRLLAEGGHKVTWWSSNFYHTTKGFRGNGQDRIRASDNLEIILVKTPRYDGNTSLRRMWNHYVYAREFRAQAEGCLQAPDVIIASAPPLLSASAALGLAEICGAKTIIDIQDIWPEAFDVALPRRLRVMARALFWPVKRLADRVYGRADGITAVSDTFLRRGLSVSANKGKGIVVPLGVDLKLYRQCLDQPGVDLSYVKNDPREFWAVYIGTIGRSYDMKTILEAADRLSGTHPNIRFLIAGDGPQLSEVQRRARRMGLPNVTFTGMMSYLHLTHLLRQCDAGMNAIAVGSGISMPNKGFDYMAAGLPLINSVKGGFERLVAEERIGLQYEAGDAESLMTGVLHLYGNAQERLAMGSRARRLAEERFDMNETYVKFQDMAIALSKPGDR